MKRAGHDSVCGIESFFNAVPMVNVNVDIEDSRVEPQQLYDTQDNIIDIAETTSF